MGKEGCGHCNRIRPDRRLIAVAAIAAFQLVGSNLTAVFNDTASKL